LLGHKPEQLKRALSEASEARKSR